MTFVLLWLLATLDSAAIGYRDAAGRNALIEKKDYYRWAMIRGALFGQVAVALVGVIVVVMLVSSPEPAKLLASFEQVAGRMLVIYVPYAVVLIITFSIRAIPSVDVRSITSVLVFGPFTLIRPLVVLAGAVWGVLAAPTVHVLILMVLIVFLMLGMEYSLDKLRARGFFYET